MRLRMLAVLAGVILISSVSVMAAETDPTASLPIYPGGKVQVEMSITDRDFLPAIQELISMAPSFLPFGMMRIPGAPAEPCEAPEAGAGAPAEPGLDEMMGLSQTMTEELRAVLAELRRVSLASYRVSEGITSQQVGEFYMQKLGLTKGWQQTMRVEEARGSVRLYTKPDLEGIFGVAVQGQNVVALRTDGRIDVVALARLAGKVVPFLMSSQHSGGQDEIEDESDEMDEIDEEIAPEPDEEIEEEEENESPG